MYLSEPLPLNFEGPEQGFGGRNYHIGSQGKPCSAEPCCSHTSIVEPKKYAASELNRESFC